MKKLNPETIAAPISVYSHGIEMPGPARWLHISGQVGMTPDGNIAQGIEAQSEAAWQNLIAILASADMGLENLVKVTAFLIDEADIPGYGAVRTKALGEARPASTLLIVKALALPDLRVEVEAVAARA
ncbi:MAG: RidA family protein [Alphaproteobacteria bacterium]